MNELLPPVVAQSLKIIDHIIAYDSLPISADERNKWHKLKADVAAQSPLQHHSSNVASPISSAPFPITMKVARP
jgi:hypothetical protein